jgi:hypothetical protein
MTTIRNLQIAALALSACGLPPTTIGARKKTDSRYDLPNGTGGDDDSSEENEDTAGQAQGKALRTLVGGSSVVIAGEPMLCVEFSAVSGTSTLQGCVVRTRTAAGRTSEPTSGTCRITGSSEFIGTHYDLECTSVQGGGCLGGAAAGSIATLESALDFEAILARDQDLDGYVVYDTETPSKTMTLRTADDYCAGETW